MISLTFDGLIVARDNRLFVRPTVTPSDPSETDRSDIARSGFHRVDRTFLKNAISPLAEFGRSLVLHHVN